MKTLDKTTLTKLAWTTALRTQGHRRCDGEFCHGNLRCALGLLGEVAGLTPFKMKRIKSGHAIGRLAGLTPHQSAYVWQANDNGVTWPEIADHIEAGWFNS